MDTSGHAAFAGQYEHVTAGRRSGAHAGGGRVVAFPAAVLEHSAVVGIRNRRERVAGRKRSLDRLIERRFPNLALLLRHLPRFPVVGRHGCLS
jgi:hypothetical protein